MKELEGKPEPAKERARWDGQEHEYELQYRALNNRLDFTMTRNAFAISTQPSVLLKIAELDVDIWDTVRPALRGDPRRVGIDAQIAFLRAEASRLCNLLLSKKNVPVGDLNHFFNKEEAVFREINDIRYEKGMGITFAKDWTDTDEKRALKYYQRGGKHEDVDGK